MPAVPEECSTIDFPPGTNIRIRISLPPPLSSGDLRYACNQCHYTCTRESLLKDHHAKVHQEKDLFLCPECKYKGQRYIHLQKHLHRKHPYLLKRTQTEITMQEISKMHVPGMLKATHKVLDGLTSPANSCTKEGHSTTPQVNLNMAELSKSSVTFPVLCSKNLASHGHTEETPNSEQQSQATDTVIGTDSTHTNFLKKIEPFSSQTVNKPDITSVRRFGVPGTNCSILACVKDNARDSGFPDALNLVQLNVQKHGVQGKSYKSCLHKIESQKLLQTSHLEEKSVTIASLNENGSFAGYRDSKSAESVNITHVYQCSSCSYSCQSHRLLKAHSERLHNTSRPVHCCDKCGQIFKQKRSLDAHIKVHAGKLDHKCQFCQKCFASQNHLRLHLLTHSSTRDHLCEEGNCQKRFRTKGHLKQHVRTVHATPTFICPHPECEKVFTLKRAMHAHYNVHTAAHSCPNPQCGQTFRDRFNLKAHQKTHTKVKWFSKKTAFNISVPEPQGDLRKD